MTDSRRNEVRCRECGELLGHLNVGSGHPARPIRADGIHLVPGIQFCVMWAIRVDIVCPACGTCRSVTPDRFHSVSGVASGDKVVS
jgi:hypothetical protein